MNRVLMSPVVQVVIFVVGCAVNGGANAEERGAVTTIAALRAQTSAFIGFTSGDVLYCARLSGCKQLDGTPKSAVTAIDISGDGNSKVVWVGYEDGNVYFCSLTGGCVIQEQVESGRSVGEQSAVDPRKVK